MNFIAALDDNSQILFWQYNCSPNELFKILPSYLDPSSRIYKRAATRPTAIKRPPAFWALASPVKGIVLLFGGYDYTDWVPVLYDLV
jgi:hypothetical protein